jgi:hypothetical protein
MQPPVTQYLLDQTNGVGSVGFVKEYHSVHVQGSVVLCLFLSFRYKFNDILLFGSSMYLK